MPVEIRVKGLKETRRFVERLAPQIEEDIARKAARSAATTIATAVRRAAPRGPAYARRRRQRAFEALADKYKGGKKPAPPLHRSITVQALKGTIKRHQSRQNILLFFGRIGFVIFVRQSAFYGWFLERGTRPRPITAKVDRRGILRGRTRSGPRIAPRYWMQRAFEASHKTALTEFVRKYREELGKVIKTIRK